MDIDLHARRAGAQLGGGAAGLGLALVARRERDVTDLGARVLGEQPQHRAAAADLDVVGVGPQQQQAQRRARVASRYQPLDHEPITG
jgi:hypothetical protein